MTDYKEVLVFAEQRDGIIHPITYELLGKGRELVDKLGGRLSGILLGNHIENMAAELVYRGADRVYMFDNEIFDDFDLLNYRHNIVKLIRDIKPEIFLLGATHWGRSLGARIAAALDTGLTADCTGLDIDRGGNFVQIRPAFSGNVLAYIRTRTRPQMATVRYKVMKGLKRDTGRKGEIIKKETELVPSLISIAGKEKSSDVNIAEAEMIISGGAGLKKAEDFSLLSDLARLFDATVGSSRPPVDSGWIGREHQVGFSGNTVKPKIYLACGISGSPQHLAGMREADVIIAINTDPSAPIFRIADYGIVADLYTVIPKLINRIKECRT